MRKSDSIVLEFAHAHKRDNDVHLEGSKLSVTLRSIVHSEMTAANWWIVSSSHDPIPRSSSWMQFVEAIAVRNKLAEWHASNDARRYLRSRLVLIYPAIRSKSSVYLA